TAATARLRRFMVVSLDFPVCSYAKAGRRGAATPSASVGSAREVTHRRGGIQPAFEQPRRPGPRLTHLTNPAMTIRDFPDRRYLIDVAGLRERLDAVTLLDLRPAEHFALGHIEGSRHLDLYGVSLTDSSPAPLDAFLSMLRILFGSRGIRAERPVVVYDHESGERASRAVWLLALLGHPDVKL